MMNNQSTVNNDSTALKLGQLLIKLEQVNRIGGQDIKTLYPYAWIETAPSGVKMVVLRCHEAIKERYESRRITDEWIAACDVALDTLAELRRKLYEEMDS